MIVTGLILLLMIALGASNGANDVAKGVATLAGSGTTRYRTAILWGALTTLAGALVSGLFAGRMLKLFASGIVSAVPTPAFTLAVICGTVGWIIVATLARVPVSTTHAIIGSLLGATLLFAPNSIAWSSLLPKFVMPLLLSILVSYVLSATLNLILVQRNVEAIDCLCVGAGQLDTGGSQFAQMNVMTGTTFECESNSTYLKLNSETLHWLSSGTVGFARGLTTPLSW